MFAHKFASLAFRREPISPDEKSRIRTRALVIMAACGVGFVALTFAGYWAKRLLLHIADSLAAFNLITMVVLVAFFWAYLTLALLVRKLWRIVRQREKIVFAGVVTGKRWFTGSRLTIPRFAADASGRHFCVSLDGVEFEVSREHHDLLAEGDRAEIHCVLPGDVFRVERTHAAARRKKQRGDQIEFRISGVDHTFAVDSDTAGRYIALGGAAFGILFTMFTAALIWWFSCDPPAALLFSGDQVTVEVARTRLVASPGKGESVRPVVEVRLPVARPAQGDDDAEQRLQKVYPLRAFPGDNKFTDRTSALQILKQYPRGKSLDVFRLRAYEHEFFAVRFAAATIISAAAIVIIGLGAMVYFGYRILRKARPRKTS